MVSTTENQSGRTSSLAFQRNAAGHHDGPTDVAVFSMESIMVLRSICKEDIMYIDATDGVLLGQSHCYVYEVVVRHPMERNPPLAVASMIT